MSFISHTFFSLSLALMNLQFTLHVLSFLLIVSVFLAKRTSKTAQKLPPGPRKLPILGNIYKLRGEVQHRVITDLSKKHGPIMHLQLAEISIIVVSSSSLANEVLKTHDLAFADRAQLQLSKIILEGCKDVAYSRYDDYWRQMKKICKVELLTVNKVSSFRSIREDEAWNLVESIKNSLDSPINLTYKFTSLSNSIAASGGGFDIADLFPSYKFLHAFSGLKSKLIKLRSRVDVIFFNIIKEHKEKRAKTKDSDGKVAGEEDLVDVLLRLQDQEGSFQFPITSSDIKGIIIDMLAAGTDTAKVMEKAQAEVRKGFKGKKKIQEVDVEDLSYLPKTCNQRNSHPPAPMLLARECREQCEVEGYTIPVGSKLFVEYWPSPDSFEPEKFE